MDVSVLTPAERRLFIALNQHEVRYLVIGLSAAVLQGAPVTTQDLGVWFDVPGSDTVKKAVADAGGFWVPAFGMQPPAIGGDGLERIDVVLTAHGLDDFDSEYGRAATRQIDDLAIKVLPLERIIASKRSANRPKDRAALPALEATLQARRERSSDEP